jgi:HK97 family phage prohead protease
MIRLTAQSVSIDAAASDGTPTRTITGIAVPYGVAATVSDGTEVIFERGSLPVDGKAPRLFLNHSSESAIGIVTARYDDEEGMMFTARISKTAQGDDALQLALDGVLDSVSVGVNPTKTRANKDGSITVLAADWIELSMVPVPAFAGAIITDIAASIHHEDEEISNIETEPTQENETMSEATVPVIEASIPTLSIPAQPKREFAMPSAAEVLAAYHIGGDTYNKVSDAFKQAQRRGQTALQAAAGDIVTGDTPGLLNIPVLGPLFQDLNFVRPVVSAFGARAMPSTTSRQFVRPTITTHTSAAVQSNQLDAVSATTMVIAANTVTKSTVAGQVTLSIQDIDFTDPSALQLVLNDLAGEVLIKTDDIAADALVAGKTASGSTWTVTANDPSSLISSLYDAAREITEDSNFFPTHLCVSPDVWEKLGSQLDGSKRPVLGYTTNGVLGQNALGRVGGLGYNMMDVMGLSLVVDNNFASGTMLVVYAPGFEIYESGASLQSFENPSTLGRTLSIHQYFATFVAKSSFIQAITIA